jgi:hypothetical protein
MEWISRVHGNMIVSPGAKGMLSELAAVGRIHMDIPSNADILALLAALDQKTADELESEVLDFKPWQDAKESKKVAVEYAACLANTSGGVVVFGVKDNVRGRAAAVHGVGNYDPTIGVKRFSRQPLQTLRSS